MSTDIRSFFCVDCGAAPHSALAEQVIGLARQLGGEGQVVKVSDAVSGIGLIVPDAAMQRMRAGLHLAGASAVEIETRQDGQNFFIMLATTQPAQAGKDETWEFD